MTRLIVKNNRTIRNGIIKVGFVTLALTGLAFKQSISNEISKEMNSRRVYHAIEGALDKNDILEFKRIMGEDVQELPESKRSSLEARLDDLYYDNIKSLIDKSNYAQASRNICLFREDLNQQQISELNKKLYAISPESIWHRAETEANLNKKIDLLGKAYNGYKMIDEKKADEVLKDYFNARILSLTEKIGEGFYKYISRELDSILSDDILFINGKTPTLKNVSNDAFDNLFVAEQRYIISYQYINLITERTPIFLKSMELVERFLPEQRKVYAGRILDVYAREVFKVINKESKGDMDDIKYLVSLQLLERKFGYKTYLNVDDIMTKRMMGTK